MDEPLDQKPDWRPLQHAGESLGVLAADPALKLYQQPLQIDRWRALGKDICACLSALDAANERAANYYSDSIRLHREKMDALDEVITLRAQLALAAPILEAGWFDVADQIPEVGESVLVASKLPDEDFWRVRDGMLLIRHEGVAPRPTRQEDGFAPVDWWFDSIYPGKGDMRLLTAGTLWRRMPTPEALPPRDGGQADG